MKNPNTRRLKATESSRGYPINVYAILDRSRRNHITTRASRRGLDMDVFPRGSVPRTLSVRRGIAIGSVS